MERYADPIHFLSFVSLASLLIVEYGETYEFITEPIELTYPTSETSYEDGLRRIQQYPLFLLSELQQVTLCELARNYVLGDQADPFTATAFMQFGIDMFGVLYLDGRRASHVALVCTTTPRIYLRVESNDGTKIVIMQRRNAFLEPQWEYHVEFVQSVSRVDDFTNEIEQYLHAARLRSHANADGANSNDGTYSLPFLVHMRNSDRRDMCMAARQRIQKEHRIAIVPEGWTEAAGKYVVNMNGSKMNRITAFPCNSKPVVYLRTVDEINVHEIVVMIVQQ